MLKKIIAKLKNVTCKTNIPDINTSHLSETTNSEKE